MLGYFCHANKKGQTLIEFALLFPVLLLITFAILEFGRLFWVTNAVSNASREAARVAIVTPELSVNNEEVRNIVRQYLEDAALSSDGLEVTNTEATGGGDFVQVSVSLPYQWLTPLPNLIARNNAPVIKREIEMRYEGGPNSGAPSNSSPGETPSTEEPNRPGWEDPDRPEVVIPERPGRSNPDDEPWVVIPEERPDTDEPWVVIPEERPDTDEPWVEIFLGT